MIFKLTSIAKLKKDTSFVKNSALSKGHFTCLKERTRFFQDKRIFTDFGWIFSETKGFLPKVYEIF